MQLERVGKWYVVQLALRMVIERMHVANGKRRSERYPYSFYEHLDAKDLQAFCDQLNAGEVINNANMEQLVADFGELLLAEVPVVKDARSLHQCFTKVTYSYFKHLEPKLWWTAQAEYGAKLAEKLSYKTIISYVQVANRFLAFYEDKTGVVVRRLKPHSTARLKLLRSKASVDVGKYIPEHHWQIIAASPPADIASLVMLQYAYGLRRSELFTLSPASVRLGFLHLAVSKSRKPRNIPHWNIAVDEAYNLIGNIKQMHADTYSEKFDAYMVSLGFSYRTHDLRRSFVTNSLRAHNAVDVQLACGHDDIRTTMKYQMDDRSLDSAAYR